jgi:heterodisulfide reductase subunit B
MRRDSDSSTSSSESHGATWNFASHLSMAVIQSQQLVVLRLGLTPSKLGYRSHSIVEALVKARP